MNNPYTLVFGQPPMEIIARTPQVDSIISMFCSARPSNYINLVTGVRGSGKTVFITEVADRIKAEKDWIVVNLNPQRDLLTSLAAKLNSDAGLSRIFKDAQINLSFFGLGVGIKTSPQIVDIEEVLRQMFKSLDKHHKRVLITIDEITNAKEVRIFTSAFQIFLREKLPVFLLMSGLHKNIDSLKNAPGMTFLERAPRTTLSPLDQELIAHNYASTLKVKADKANRLAKLTKGYSFAFQILGYYSWDFPEDEERVRRSAQDYLYEFAYNKIWSELSKKDREVIIAAARAGTDQVAEIRSLLQISTNQFNPYRDRLIKAGVFSYNDYGHIEMALPFFDTYALKRRGVLCL